jgi:hypothetical protein
MKELAALREPPPFHVMLETRRLVDVLLPSHDGLAGVEMRYVPAPETHAGPGKDRLQVFVRDSVWLMGDRTDSRLPMTAGTDLRDEGIGDRHSRSSISLM